MDSGHGLYLEDISLGMSDAFAKAISEQDIVSFAEISGDTNPVHLDAEFAAQSIFGERIAHGILSASLISAVLGTRLPGPGCIYISQSLRFRAPVKIGDHVEARVTVTDINQDRQRITVETVCRVGETVVVDGEAQLKVNRRADIVESAENAAATA